MWKFLSKNILRYRVAYTVTLLVITGLLAFKATEIKLSYQFVKILPTTDTTFIEYEKFKKLFGEDGSVMMVGLEDKSLFTLNKFNDWTKLNSEIKQLSGIQDVMSIARLYNIRINDSLKKFEFFAVVPDSIKSQTELDSIKHSILSLPFYEGLIYNPESGATIMAITFSNKDLNTKNRIAVVNKIKAMADAYGLKHHIQMHYSGMPYIRTAITAKVSNEMGLFLGLALLILAIILWLFFRSFTSVFFSLIVVAIGVIWSIGTLSLFGYQITILSSLIPPIISVIGIPNCIFLINKYQTEIAKHGDKNKALMVTIQTTGITLFLANITTAIGFGVLYFTSSWLLIEFGVVTALNVMATYFITLFLIPIVLSLLPIPTSRHMKHLEGKRINNILIQIDKIVHNHRKALYFIIGGITLISAIGMTKISVVGFVVDDLPAKDPICLDLKFFETNFKGILPFEISIDTKKPNGVFDNNAEVLYKIKRLQRMMAEYPIFSKPISVTEAIKFSYQAYRGGDKKYYALPGAAELQKLSNYSSSTLQGKSSKFKAFLDSNKQVTRVSFQIADIGSARIGELTKELRPRIDSIFDPKTYKVTMTGHCLVFAKGNNYLLENLFESLIIEIILILLIGLTLFKSIRIIVLSKIPCLIPLIITAGIMGFLNIRFKPSTILIFSIAFGISSDQTIYFLSKYRQELMKGGRSISDAVSTTIKESGLSMIYTAIIMFCGFAIFTVSSFGGTQSMGLLISVTLLVTVCTNLVLLPAFLLSLEKHINNKEFLEEPIVDITEEVNETLESENLID